jgi:Fur family transcriptional regulator, peroxide stress response regulator
MVTLMCMRTPRELTVAFRERGMKDTPQRQAIFAHLHSYLGHPTAEAVYVAIAQDMPSISLRTVYQTLNDLVAMGELTSVDLEGGAVRFDPNTTDHHHALCRRCGSLADVDLDLSSLSLQLRTFCPDSMQVVVHGLCASCSSPIDTP